MTGEKMPYLRCVYLTMVVCTIFVTSASAEPVYTYITNANAFTASPGGTVKVQIFLNESLSFDDTSLINSNGGLYVGGFQVAVAPNQINTGSISSIAGDATTFDGGFFIDPADTSTNARGDNLTALADTSGPMASMGLISLGYVNINASSVVGTTTTFQVGAYSPGKGGYIQTFNDPFFDLDVTNNGDSSASYIGAGGTASNPILFSNTFSVMSVAPEPVLTSTIVFGLVFCRRARRRKMEPFVNARMANKLSASANDFEK